MALAGRRFLAEFLPELNELTGVPPLARRSLQANHCHGWNRKQRPQLGRMD
jgi:hypothetical protein